MAANVSLKTHFLFIFKPNSTFSAWSGHAIELPSRPQTKATKHCLNGKGQVNGCVCDTQIEAIKWGPIQKGQIGLQKMQMQTGKHCLIIKCMIASGMGL